jgi:hypothetical protein
MQHHIRKRTNARERQISRRRVKRLIVEAGARGWLTAQQARFALSALGLRHD